jgi:hypothetical protein
VDSPRPNETEDDLKLNKRWKTTSNKIWKTTLKKPGRRPKKIMENNLKFKKIKIEDDLQKK